MCKVDRKTIVRVNKKMMAQVRMSNIPVANIQDNQIIVPVRLFGIHKYKMSLDKVNEIYGRAKEKALSKTPINIG